MAAVNENADLEVRSYDANANRTVGGTNRTVFILSLSFLTIMHAQKHRLGPWSSGEYTSIPCLTHIKTRNAVDCNAYS
jgi:hypothetical protein